MKTEAKKPVLFTAPDPINPSGKRNQETGATLISPRSSLTETGQRRKYLSFRTSAWPRRQRRPTFRPHYFQAYYTNGWPRCDFHLVDGGVGANNPTMVAISRIAREGYSAKMASRKKDQWTRRSWSSSPSGPELPIEKEQR
jgi:hypothetical protein